MLMIPNKGNIRHTGTPMSLAGSATFGTSVTTGGSVTSKGSATEIISSTEFDTYWITVLASGYGAAAAGSDGCFDLMVGAATEEVLIPDMLMGGCGGDPTVGAGGFGSKRWDFPLYIPAGTRISAKAAGRRTSTAFRVAVYLYGSNGYPPFKVGSKVTTYGMGTIPGGTAITPGASGANGSITQITAATTENHFAFVPSLQVTNDATMTSAALSACMFYGGSGAETPIGGANRPFRFLTGSSETMSGPENSFPAFENVPSGTRLSMRVSSSTTIDAGYTAVIHAVS